MNTRGPATDLAGSVAEQLRDIPDFPEPGVVFKDITPLLLNPQVRSGVVADIAGRAAAVDVVAGLEARGFILGGAVAHELGLGFVPVRKAGKLPWHTHAVSYDLEYGSATLEVHQDAFEPGQRVLIVDDVLATGGTAAAACALVAACDAQVAAVEVVVELGFLNGRSMLGDHQVRAVLTL